MKSFKDKLAQNPTLQFISTETASEAQKRPQEVEERPVSTNTQAAAKKPTEAKTRRLQLLLTPSLYEQVKAAAEKDGLSVNEYINAALRAATEGASK